jgi:hypothetical protein
MQDNLKQDLIKLKQREGEFTRLVNSSSREDLARCTRFLAMYIALYRQKFGDIPDSGYKQLIEAPVLDSDLLEIIDEGIHEASEMLKLIHMQKIRLGIKIESEPYLN